MRVQSLIPILAALAVAAAALIQQPAFGQSVEGARLRGEQAKLNNREVMRAQAQTLSKEVEDLRAELILLGRSQALGEGRAARERAQLQGLHKREKALLQSLGRNRSQLSRLLGALQLYQRDPPPPLFVHARSARNAARAAVLMKAVTPELEARGKVLSARTEAVRKVRRQAAAASETLLLTESEVEDRRSRIERLIAEKSALEGRLLADAAAEEEAARRLAANASSLSDLAGDLAARGRPGAGLQLVQLVQPVQGRLVRRFGERAGRGQAEGVTWRTQASAQVLAPTDARVEYVGPLKGYGLIVILRAGDAYQVVLAGLDQAASGAGRSVAAGEPIGRMSGDGSELYLEVRREGEPVDPGRWLAGSSQRPGQSRG